MASPRAGLTLRVSEEAPHILTIPGMKTRAHLRENLAAGSLTLSAAQLARLGERTAELGIRGERHPPAMMQIIDR